MPILGYKGTNEVLGRVMYTLGMTKSKRSFGGQKWLYRTPVRTERVVALPPETPTLQEADVHVYRLGSLGLL